jgi:hypothetical protein
VKILDRLPINDQPALLFVGSEPILSYHLMRILWPIWAAALGLGFLPTVSPPLSTYLRVGSSCVLVAAAWIGAWRLRSWETRGILELIALGMTLGCLGDAWALVPEGLIPVHRLIPAMVLFGLGHVAYITAFLEARRPELVRTPRLDPLVWGLWLSVVLIAWQFSVNVSPAPMPLRWSALAYSSLLGSTAAVSSALAVEQPRYRLAALGAALFLASDIVLAVQSFRGPFPFDTDLCWAAYGPGQMLIVYGMARGEAHPRAGFWTRSHGLSWRLGP